MLNVSLTLEEVEYLRYLVSVHAGTELEEKFDDKSTIRAVRKIIKSLKKKLEVR